MDVSPVISKSKFHNNEIQLHFRYSTARQLSFAVYDIFNGIPKWQVKKAQFLGFIGLNAINLKKKFTKTFLDVGVFHVVTREKLIAFHTVINIFTLKLLFTLSPITWNKKSIANLRFAEKLKNFRKNFKVNQSFSIHIQLLRTRIAVIRLLLL